MSEKIQAVRGMNDVLPDQSPFWQFIEKTFSECLLSYGYQEIRFPLVESTQLFKRTIGQVTDIVEKEMYTFNDVNGDSLSLRPEGTAGCVRACLEHNLFHHQQPKLWYMGPMFRHERPQKGRYRQFNQFGVETFGISDPVAELELISICFRLWKQLGFIKEVELQINTLGELEERQAYRKLLVEFFKDHIQELDEENKERLEKNPLRILDSKNPSIQALCGKAPHLIEVLGEQSKEHFHSFCAGLKSLNIPYTINPFLVRGLDYYGHTVFEWVTQELGSQGTICAGGRYNLLVEQLGGNSIPAAGFALGIERILLLMETLNLNQSPIKEDFLYIIGVNSEAILRAILLAESIHEVFPEMKIITNTSGGSFKSQFKKADKSGARLALILGEDELAKQQISVKDLRKETEQMTIDQSNINQFLSEYFMIPESGRT